MKKFFLVILSALMMGSMSLSASEPVGMSVGGDENLNTSGWKSGIYIFRGQYQNKTYSRKVTID
jgi:hypothetical protein